MRWLLALACLYLVAGPAPAGPDLMASVDSVAQTADADTVVLPIPQMDAPDLWRDDADMDDADVEERPVAGLAPQADAPIDIPQQSAAGLVLEPHAAPPAVAKPVVHRSREEVCDTLAKSAQSNDLPIPFFIRLLWQESGFEPGLVSRAGAQGVAQFMPETASSVGLDNPFDPLQAIPASARLLRNFIQRFGNLGLAAAAYNAGPKRIQDWLTKKGKLPAETQGYVKIITGRPAETWKAAAAGNTELTLPHHAPCQDKVPVRTQVATLATAAKTHAAHVVARIRQAAAHVEKSAAHAGARIKDAAAHVKKRAIHLAEHKGKGHHS